MSATAILDLEAGRARGTRTPSLLALAAMVLAGAALAINAGGLVLSSPHEARVLETAREMLETRDWVLPRFAGETRLQKPPLPYWASAAAYVVAREPSVRAARLVVALLGVLAVGATFLVGRSLGDARAGALGALMLAGSMLQIEEFRHVTTDPFLAAFCAMFAAAAASAWRRPARTAPRMWVAAGAFLALALLSKGPVALLFCGLAFAFTRPRGARIRWGMLSVGAVAALLPMCAWGVAVVLRLPGGLAVWMHELGARIPGEGEADPGRGPYLYATELALGWLPWTPILALALATRLPAMRGVKIWFLAGIAVLMALPSRKAAYMLPLMPPAALVMGALAAAPRAALVRRVLLANFVLIPIGLGALAGTLPLHHYERTLETWIEISVLAVAIAAICVALWRGRLALETALIAGAIGCGLWWSGWVAVQPQDLSRWHLGRFLAETIPEHERFVALGVRDPIVAFYAHRTPEPLPADALLPPGHEPVWILAYRARAVSGSRAAASLLSATLAALGRPGLRLRAEDLGTEMASTLWGFRQGAKRSQWLPAGSALVVLRRGPRP